MTVIVDNKMVVVGGNYYNSSNTHIYALDLRSLKWELQKATGYQNERDHIPESLDEHTAVAYEDSVITFGGFVGGERSNLVH